MGNGSPFEIGQTFGLSDPEVRILYKVACWLNELTFEIHDRPWSIATDYEPTLRRLCGEKWSQSGKMHTSS
jgi:hypothetical protein